MKRIAIALLTLVACRGEPAPAQGAYAVGREFSVLNIPAQEITANHAVGREFTTLNEPYPSLLPNSAVGREFSTLNEPYPSLVANAAVGREFTLNNDMSAAIPGNEAIGREFSTYVTPYTLSEVAQALRIASGLETAVADTIARLNVITRVPSASIVDVLDAACIAWLQAHAPPD